MVRQRARISLMRYDRLLQSVQGLVLQFQAIVDDAATGAVTRARIEAILKSADQVLAEARDRAEQNRATP